MKKHLIFTCIGYCLFGVGMTIQQIGIEAHLGLWPAILVFTFCMAFFLLNVVISLPKLKKFIQEHEKVTP